MNKSMLSKAIVSAIATLGLTLSSAMAATYTWTGGTGNWNDSDNWDANGIPGNATDDITYINNGGTAVIAADAVSYNLTLAYAGWNTGFIEQTGGTLDVTNLLKLRQGTSAYTLKGGTLNTGGISMGRFKNDPSQSYTFTQTGGTLLNRGGWIIYNGDYTIRGGSFQQNGRFNSYGSFHIIGSGSSIMIGDGGITTSYGFEGTGTVEFVLDNSAAHISTVEMNASQNRRSGNLKVSLHGGVLLTDTATFKLTHTTGTYSTINPGWGSAGDLWTVALNQGVAGNRYDAVTLDTNNRMGTLDAAVAKNHLAITGSTVGYIGLVNVTGTGLDIGLDFGDAGTDFDIADLELFRTGLTDAGIDWTNGYGRYEVGLSLDPTISGGNYFAWDLGGIGDGTLQLQGIANVIPEPSSLLLLGLAGLALMRRRR